MLGITLLFVLAQGFYLAKHIEQPSDITENN
jgi:intracellular septation protein A